MRVLAIAIMLLFSCFVSAKQMFVENFDNTDAPPINVDGDSALAGTMYAFPYPLVFDETYLSPKGGCFRRSAGHPFDSYAYSTKHIFSGSRSWRNEIRTNYPNRKGKCQFTWVNAENKNRNELSVGAPVAGQQVILPWGTLQHGAPAQWYAFAMYIPSDEGNFNEWIKTGQNSIVLQFMGSGNSSTPEIHWILGGSNGVPWINVALQTSSNADREVIERTDWKFNVPTDMWHTFLIYWVRDWDSDGRFILWMNCDDWRETSLCKPIIERIGKTSIRDKPTGFFSLGLYDSYVDTNKEKVMYFDALRISNVNSNFTQAASGLIPPSTVEPLPKPYPPTWAHNKPDGDVLVLNWKHPTQRVNDAELSPDEIKATTVHWECNGQTGNTNVASPATTFNAGLPVDVVCNYTLATVDTDGTASDWSAVYTYDPFAPTEPPKPGIEDVDTTYFEAWLMVFGALQLIFTVLIFALMLKVYRKFYDDLPKPEPEAQEVTPDTPDKPV